MTLRQSLCAQACAKKEKELYEREKRCREDRQNREAERARLAQPTRARFRNNELRSRF